MVVTVESTEVAIFYHNDQLYCVQALCPHRGAPLVDSHICEGLAICSWHRSIFELESGNYISGPCNPNISLRKYKIWQESDNVIIEL